MSEKLTKDMLLYFPVSKACTNKYNILQQCTYISSEYQLFAHSQIRNFFSIQSVYDWIIHKFILLFPQLRGCHGHNCIVV